jgi:uncharacterized protein YjbI with pentapeptide repeats
MSGRLLRVSGTVLVIAVALVTPVLVTSAPASADTVIGTCTIVANPTPTNFTNCPGANLSSANLSGVDLSYANLAGANLVPYPFSGTGFQNANLSSANLSGVSTVGCVALPFGDAAFCFGTDFSGANLTDANLTFANLGTCQTVSSQFFGELTACGGDSFSGADLTRANFIGASLVDTDFSGTILVPSNQAVNATSSAGAVVTWPAPQSLPGATPGPCTPQSGSTFVPGITRVTCQVIGAGVNPGGGSFTVTVNPMQTTTSISTFPIPPITGHFVVYTAIVSPIPPGGTVDFTDNGSSIGGCSAVPLYADGSAVCATTPSTAGSHTIVATYSGYTNSAGVDFPASASPSSTQNVLSCQAFAGCNMSGLDLTNADLESIDLHGANLSGSNLTDAVLTGGVDLSGANLSGTNLTGAVLTGGVDLSGANLSGANLSAADLGGAIVTADTNFNKVTWSNTTCPDDTNSNNDGGTCVGHL